MKKKGLFIITGIVLALTLSGCVRNTNPTVEKPSDNTDVKTEENVAPVFESDSEKDDEMTEDFEPMFFVTAVVNDEIAFSIELEDNEAGKAFFENLRGNDLTIVMHEYGGFEKVGDLPWELPADDEEMTAQVGDIMLYQGNQLTVFYGENTWEYTKIGRFSKEDEDLVIEYFGGEDEVTVKIFLEGTE